MILIGAKNSEIYPIGGIMPALWMIDELGLASQIIVAGILIIGGMTGFYLTLTFWKERTIISHNNERETKNLDITNEDSSEKVNVKSKIFQWFNCVAYSTLAALLGRMIVFPAGILDESDLIIRILVLITCVAIYLLSKKNLVIPTIMSAVFLTILNNIN